MAICTVKSLETQNRKKASFMEKLSKTHYTRRIFLNMNISEQLKNIIQEKGCACTYTQKLQYSNYEHL